jgi:tRNA pseudouridine55 synthase
VPPMVSAIKVAGERLYAKARRGEEVERAPRPIVIHALELLELVPGERPLATLDVVCSGGTYVRSLAADLGRALGTLAHLDSLRRTAVGRFTEADAHTLEDLAGPGRLEAAVLDPAAAMASTATRALTPAEAAALATGRTLDPTGRGDPVAAVGPDGRLVAVIQDSAGRARPKVVLA